MDAVEFKITGTAYKSTYRIRLVNRKEGRLKPLAIVFLCIGAAVAYGIVHDQITARICVEYFTIGHPKLFGTHNPTLLGIGWGIVATWWFGLILGIPLTFAARFGDRPKRTAASLVRPVAVLMGITACGAALAGFIGFVAACVQLVYLVEPLASEVPAGRHVPFLTDLWIHWAATASGLLAVSCCAGVCGKAESAFAWRM